MRQDQFEKLQQLEEKLLDVALGEADPATWPGDGIKPANMDKDTRGDRYWCKKNAVATIALAVRIQSLMARVQYTGAGTTPTDGDDDAGDDEGAHLDKEVMNAEREAKKLLKALQAKPAHGSKAG